MGIERFKGVLLTLVTLSLTTLSLLTVSIVFAEGGLPPRAPIYIEGNAGFTAANGVVAGSSTAGDPYIIEGWDISVENAPWFGHQSGITIRYTDAHFIIRNCYVHGGKAEDHYGIEFDGVTNGRIDNVIIENNGRGIVLSEVGVTIRNRHLFVHSSNNIISNSIVRNNLTGIYLLMADNNIISSNLVENNEWGIQLILLFSIEDNQKINKTVNNHIYHNNFINNNFQGHLISLNYWDHGYPSGGNYWSDYTGVDENHGENQNMPGDDGIGDTPYRGSGYHDQDRYPLMSPWEIDFVPEELPEEAPTIPMSWPLIGVVGAIVIIGIAVFYMRKR